MTADDLIGYRGVLGERWGFGRPLSLDEMARCLKLKGRMPGASMRDYERGKTAITGPIEVAVLGLLERKSAPPWAAIHPLHDAQDPSCNCPICH